MDLADWHDEHRQDFPNADARCRCLLTDGRSQRVYALLVNHVVAAVHVLMSPLTLGGKRFAREGARGLIAGGSVASLQAVADQIGAAGGAVEAAQVDALMHGQSSVMEAFIGGGARRRSNMRRQGRRCRTPKGRRQE